jgi:hypothetical protein
MQTLTTVKTTNMFDIFYTPINTQFANTAFMSIRIDNIDYYIVSQLPLDTDGINGFPIPKDKIVREVDKIVFGCHYFNVEGLDGWVACISHDQLDEIVVHFACKHDCNFCWDLLRIAFNNDLRRANDYRRAYD